MTTPSASQQLYERARLHVPAGTHSNSRIRNPHPVYAASAHGAVVTDVDGAELIDFTMGNGSVILGHADPDVTSAVQDAVRNGLTTGLETPSAVAATELMAQLVPGFDSVRFANTGTEAVLHALQIARAATGRTRVAKPEASYHGWLDEVWVSTWPPLDQAGDSAAPNTVPGSAGLARDAQSTLVLPFNDAAAAVRLIDENADTLAAVIVEPVMIDVGFIPATDAYLTAIRDAAAKHGIILIFDELLTGFRIAPGGAREHYGITPDLTMYGKAIANGYPVSAVEGRHDLLAMTDPTSGGTVGWVGTFNGHAVCMAAAEASLTKLQGGAVQHALAELTADLAGGVADVATDTGVPMVCAGGGGHFQIYFMDHLPRDYRDSAQADQDRYRAFASQATEDGLIVTGNPLGHNALCAAHTTDHLEQFLTSLRRSIAA